MIGLAIAAALTATPADLARVFPKARPGDVVRLAPGTYARPKFADVSFSPPVTITSQNPARPAVFSGIAVANAKGLIFTDLELTTAGVADPYFAFRAAKLSDVTFRRLDVHGDPAKSMVDQVNGFYIADSQNVRFEGNAFHDLDAAINIARTEGVTVVGNSFTRLDKGGVHFGQAGNVRIENNRFGDFKTGPKTHADLVQFFTAGTTAASHDILIKGNVFVRGDGWAPQGFFLRDEKGNLPYRNVTIVDNLLVGAQWNGIFLEGAEGDVVIRGNVLASWPGADPLKPVQTDYISWITLLGDLSRAKIDVSGNSAQQIKLAGKGGAPKAKQQGNRSLGKVRDEGAALVRDWADRHPGSIKAGWKGGR